MRLRVLTPLTRGLRGAAGVLLIATVCGRANADAPAAPGGQALRAGPTAQW